MTFVSYVQSNCPVVIDEYGATHEETLEYLLHRRFTELLKGPTVVADTHHLAVWLNFLQIRGRTYFQATSLDLENFRDYLLDSEDLTPQTINLYVKTICEAYWYCQTRGMVQNMIGWLDRSNPNQKYLIEVDKAPESSKSPYVIPYRLRVPNQSQNPVPNKGQIDEMRAQIDDWDYPGESDLAESLRARDSLMFRWLSEVGLRRAELVNLWVDDIPEHCSDAVPRVTISRGTKKGKSRNVEIPRSLYEETLNFIDLQRDEILKYKRSKFGSPNGIRVLFVNGSNNSVRPQMGEQAIYQWVLKLNPQGCSKKNKFSPHALRRYALTEFATHLWKVEMNSATYSPTKQLILHQNLMHRLAVQAGHESADTTIKFYIDMGFRRADNQTNPNDLVRVKEELERKLNEVNKLLGEHAG